jgi:hypothetical protein
MGHEWHLLPLRAARCRNRSERFPNGLGPFTELRGRGVSDPGHRRGQALATAVAAVTAVAATERNLGYPRDHLPVAPASARRRRLHAAGRDAHGAAARARGTTLQPLLPSLPSLRSLPFVASALTQIPRPRIPEAGTRIALRSARGEPDRRWRDAEGRQHPRKPSTVERAAVEVTPGRLLE